MSEHASERLYHLLGTGITGCLQTKVRLVSISPPSTHGYRLTQASGYTQCTPGSPLSLEEVEALLPAMAEVVNSTGVMLL